MQKNRTSTMVLFLITLLAGCKPDISEERIFQFYKEGHFNKAMQMIDRYTSGRPVKEDEKNLEILKARMERIQKDFSKTEEDIKKELHPWFPNLPDSQLRRWEREKKLEMRMINNEPRYFRNAVPNLFRLDSLAMQVRREKEGPSVDPLKAFCLNHTTELISHATGGNELPDQVYPFQIDFTITLKADAVPPNETIRCWMPFPRESLPRQKNDTLLSVNSPDFTLAPNTSLQRSLYISKKTEAGKPTVFHYTARFETAPQWIADKERLNQPYDTLSSLYKQFTSERPPHISFTERINQLAGEITAGITGPFNKVKAIYYWIDRHIPWASALEYSTFENIPQYVLENQHGDCGMQTLLFMALARASGIPCKWQSGWMLHPGEVNLHDWCEVYYEGTGWVPLDQSFGLQESDNQNIKEFYITGIDPWRLIINDDYSRPFQPPKKFFRSEPIDFQRGELEWSGGNIYFDQWNYQLNVKSLKEKKK